MTAWTPDDLASIDSVGEIDVAAHRPDGTLRTPRIVWHVVVDGALFIRSVRGTDGAWYRGVQRTGTGQVSVDGVTFEVTFTGDHDHDEAIDQAYRAKYGNGSAVQAITSTTAATTTLRVDPA